MTAVLVTVATIFFLSWCSPKAYRLRVTVTVHKSFCCYFFCFFLKDVKAHHGIVYRISFNLRVCMLNNCWYDRFSQFYKTLIIYVSNFDFMNIINMSINAYTLGTKRTYHWWQKCVQSTKYSFYNVICNTNTNVYQSPYW